VRKSHSKQKGESMKRNFFRTLMVSLAGAVLATVAYAGDTDRLIVDMPCDFVVNGKTLPAGKYYVKRNSDSNLRILSISSFENHVYTVTLSADVTDTREFRPGVTLIRTGERSILTKVRTAEHVFTIPVSRADSQAASASRSADLSATYQATRQ
jgi:hypothetical protein